MSEHEAERDARVNSTIDAIDGALDALFETESGDAMRWVPPEARTEEDRPVEWGYHADGDNHWWWPLTDIPANPAPLPDGWVNIGYVMDEATEVYRRSQETEPWPTAVEAINPPRFPLIEDVRYAADGIHAAVESMRANPPRFPRIVVTPDDLGMTPEPLTRMFEAIRRAVRDMVPVIKRAYDATAAFNRAVEESGGLIPETARERALWLRQNRSTGPSTDPFRHRGATWQSSRSSPPAVSGSGTRTRATSRRSPRGGSTR